MKRIVVIGGGAVAVLAIGLWLGHDTQTSSRDAVSGQAVGSATSDTRAPITRARVQPRPAMPTRSPSPAAAIDLAIDARDPDPRVRRSAIADVAASEAPDPQILLIASRDRDPNVGVAATEGLGKLYRDGQISARELVVRIADHGLNDKVRVAAINGLGLVASRDSAAALGDLLGHGDVIEKRSAAILFVHQDPTVAIPALIAALGDPDPLVRSNAHDGLRSLARGRDFGDDANAWSSWWQSRR